MTLHVSVLVLSLKTYSTCPSSSSSSEVRATAWVLSYTMFAADVMRFVCSALMMSSDT
ncbi:hypothetical protein PR003_g16532 [Phytophthora rubi]|uniref:Uncharacterized protein n=1 Tax=Phytophthora rubi TaxID=129364 RepID=A0A6A3K856_9STRA|nr:hypothetical protein PR002_g17220 [Phytophthora rubi]KAE9007266.1 hypothetical protein PR001_g17010 [Phytophthora rubi]KAE9325262.1 hypothetical protein PR003_g16532 [Phytophthora rubi]